MGKKGKGLFPPRISISEILVASTDLNHNQKSEKNHRNVIISQTVNFKAVGDVLELWNVLSEKPLGR